MSGYGHRYIGTGCPQLGQPSRRAEDRFATDCQQICAVRRNDENQAGLPVLDPRDLPFQNQRMCVMILLRCGRVWRNEKTVEIGIRMRCVPCDDFNERYDIAFAEILDLQCFQTFQEQLLFSMWQLLRAVEHRLRTHRESEERSSFTTPTANVAMSAIGIDDKLCFWSRFGSDAGIDLIWRDRRKLIRGKLACAQER